MTELAIKSAMNAGRHTLFRRPGIAARLTAARRPI
jgi:hypothetical protein